jgi:hypothetical protein
MHVKTSLWCTLRSPVEVVKSFKGCIIYKSTSLEACHRKWLLLCLSGLKNLKLVDSKMRWLGSVEPLVLEPEVLLGDLVFSRSHRLHRTHARDRLKPMKKGRSTLKWHKRTAEELFVEFIFLYIDRTLKRLFLFYQTRFETQEILKNLLQELNLLSNKFIRFNKQKQPLQKKSKFWLTII